MAAKRSYETAVGELPPEEEIGYISKVSDQLTSKKMNRYFEGVIELSPHHIDMSISTLKNTQNSPRLKS